jgi:LDH2 family malate/lactate/ureidoglycolate dehydrogenase
MEARREGSEHQAGMNASDTTPVTAHARVSARLLTEFSKAVFARMGLPEEDAATVADALVWADLRGIDSHGVLRIPSYLDYIRSGRMNPRPNISVVRETVALACIDAERAVGAVSTVAAMRKAIDKAKHAGIGWVVVRNVTHQGALGYYALMASDAGMAGLVNTCGTPVMAAYGSKAVGLHNSPIAIAVPAKRHRPLLLDMAHSVAAGGKIKLAADARQRIPADWALDAEGNPTTDPDRARILLPLGGPKGSGIAILFECLSSLMAQNPILAREIPAMLDGAPREHTQNSIVAAIDIAAFTGLDSYRDDVDELVDALKQLPPAPGHAEICVPGELGYRTSDERTRSGIPLPSGTVERLRAVADEVQVPFPVPV